MAASAATPRPMTQDPPSPSATQARAIVAAYSRRAKRKSASTEATPAPPKRTTRSRANNINKQLESLCRPVSVAISVRDSRACARSPPPSPPPAGEEDRGQEPSPKKRKRTRREIDELAAVARRKKQQRLDFGQHFKRPP